MKTFGLLALSMCFLIAGCSSDESTTAPAGGDDSSAAPGTPDTPPAGDNADAGDDAAAATGEATLTGEEIAKTLLAGLENEQQLPEAFRDSMQAYEANPKMPENAVQYMHITSVVGMLQARAGKDDVSRQAYTIAAEVLDQARADQVRLPPIPLPIMVDYNYATVLSHDGQAEKAADRLTLAIEAGFNDFRMIESDDSLKAVRELPDFASRMETWKAEYAAAMKEEALTQLAAGETFPFDFQLTNVVDGSPVNLADHSGKVRIVDIWGTWCGPCVGEIPSFVKLQETYGDAGFQMIGLNSEGGADAESDAAKVKSFIDANGVNYPCALISEDVLDMVPNMQGYPTTLFIDRSGKVRMKLVGAHDYGYLEAIVVALLEEGDAAATGSESGD